jgi:hypothetical protein
LALSIGYATRDADYAKGHRVLRELALYEVSLVAMPMNTQARITQVKSAALAASEIRDPVAFERFLKANGFANSTARRLAAGFNDAVGRSSDDEAIQQLAVLLKESAAFHKAN